MTQLPPEPLIPDNTLITRRLRKEGPSTLLSRGTLFTRCKKEVEVLRSGRAQYARDPN